MRKIALIGVVLACAAFQVPGPCSFAGHPELKCDPKHPLTICEKDSQCPEEFSCSEGFCKDCPEDLVCSLDGLCKNNLKDSAVCGKGTLCFGRCVADEDKLNFCVWCDPPCSAMEACCPGYIRYDDGSKEMKMEQGTCVVLDNNEDHCGECGEVCNSDLFVTKYCVAGSCSATCAYDSDCKLSEACCHDQCIDVFRDPDNCGSCGAVCAKSGACCQGNCVHPDYNSCQ